MSANVVDRVQVGRRRNDNVDAGSFQRQISGVSDFDCRSWPVLFGGPERHPAKHDTHRPQEVVERVDQIFAQYAMWSAVRNIERKGCSSLLGDDQP